MKMKICIIGGGSRLWAPILFKDLASTEGLSGEIDLYDIDHRAARQNEQLGNTIFKHPSAASVFHMQYRDTVEKALDGADFVIFSIEPGPTEMRYADLVLPAKYGILQTVGDTTGPGGLLRAERAIPIFREYASLVMKHCPDAWVINYTNPMTLCTAALYKQEPNIKAIGCCHEVIHTKNYLAQKVSEWFDTEQPKRQEIDLDLGGINHFTFAGAVRWNGNDVYPHLIDMLHKPGTFQDRSAASLEREKNEQWFDSDYLIALDFLRNFNALGAAGDRHLAEFVPWYLSSEKDLRRYGIMLTPYSWRLRDSKEKKNKIFPADELIPERSDEEGVDIIKALLGMAPLKTNVNFPNSGQIDWLPSGHIVETNASFTRNDIRPEKCETLPEGIKALVSRVAAVQSLALEAVFQNDTDLLFQAFLSDPLMSLPITEAKKLFHEMHSFKPEIQSQFG